MWEKSEERDKYETISRIQFNHRGQIALARSTSMSTQEKISLRGQFFITLDSTAWLNDNHVIFGTIGTSPTIFNALRIGRSIVIDEKNNPTPIDLDSVKITNVSVKSNLFENELMPNTHIPWKKNETKNKEQAAKIKKEKKRKKLLAKKNINVLSFGVDEDEDEDEIEVDDSAFKKTKKIKSEKDKKKEKLSDDSSAKLNEKEMFEEKNTKKNHYNDPAKEDQVQNNSESHNVNKNAHEYKKQAKEIPKKPINQKVTINKSNNETNIMKPKQKETPKQEEISNIIEERRSKYINANKSHRRGDKKKQDVFSKLSAFRTKIIDAKSFKATAQVRFF